MPIYQATGNPCMIIDPCWDPVFKSIFTKDTPKSKKVLADFLSAILQHKIKIVHTTADDTPVLSQNDRQLRYDIDCMTDSGENANIKMSLFSAGGEANILEYYLASLYTKQHPKGSGPTHAELKHCYQIALFANRALFKDEHFYHCFVYHDTKRQIDLGGWTAVITLELSKLAKIAEKPVTKMTECEKWAVFLAYYTDENKDKLIRRITESVDEISLAKAAIHEFTAEELAFFHEAGRGKYELNTHSGACEESFAEGFAKGITKGRVEERRFVIELLEHVHSVEEIKQILTER